MRRDTIPDDDGNEKPFRAAREALGLWTGETRGADRVLTKAARRSAEEVRAVLDAGGRPGLATAARLGDLSRAQWFLWAGAGLAAGERASRGLWKDSLPPAGYSPRASLLGTLAADLYLGYAALRERATVEGEER